MPARHPSILKGIAHGRTMRHLRGLADRIETQDVTSLRPLRSQAREIMRAAGTAYLHAEARLALPLIGGAPIEAPVQSDWRHRPEIWTRPIRPSGLAGPANRTVFGDEATLYHDCPLAEVTLRQERNRQLEDVAPFGLSVDVLGFEGSFLSLAIDLPPKGIADLRRRHIIRLAAHVACENPLEVYARLNIKHGPNTEQLTRDFDLGSEDLITEWDLTYLDINENRIEAAWIDLILDRPAFNRIVLRDLTVSRRPRADV